MPHARFRNLPAEKRARILEAAGQAFSEHGYEAASLNHILAHAGISKGAAYYYFEDKADLFVTVAQHCLDHLMADVDFRVHRLRRETFWPMVEALYREATEHFATVPWMSGVAKAIWRLSPLDRTSSPLQELFDSVHGMVAAIIRRGRRLRVIRTDLPEDLEIRLAIALDAAVDSWALAHRGPDLSLTELLRITDLLLKGFQQMVRPPAAEEP